MLSHFNLAALLGFLILKGGEVLFFCWWVKRRSKRKEAE